MYFNTIESEGGRKSNFNNQGYTQLTINKAVPLRPASSLTIAPKFDPSSSEYDVTYTVVVPVRATVRNVSLLQRRQDLFWGKLRIVVGAVGC